MAESDAAAPDVENGELADDEVMDADGTAVDIAMLETKLAAASMTSDERKQVESEIELEKKLQKFSRAPGAADLAGSNGWDDDDETYLSLLKRFLPDIIIMILMGFLGGMMLSVSGDSLVFLQKTAGGGFTRKSIWDLGWQKKQDVKSIDAFMSSSGTGVDALEGTTMVNDHWALFRAMYIFPGGAGGFLAYMGGHTLFAAFFARPKSAGKDKGMRYALYADSEPYGFFAGLFAFGLFIPMMAWFNMTTYGTLVGPFTAIAAVFSPTVFCVFGFQVVRIQTADKDIPTNGLMTAWSRFTVMITANCVAAGAYAAIGLMLLDATRQADAGAMDALFLSLFIAMVPLIGVGLGVKTIEWSFSECEESDCLLLSGLIFVRTLWSYLRQLMALQAVGLGDTWKSWLQIIVSLWAPTAFSFLKRKWHGAMDKGWVKKMTAVHHGAHRTPLDQRAIRDIVTTWIDVAHIAIICGAMIATNVVRGGMWTNAAWRLTPGDGNGRGVIVYMALQLVMALWSKFTKIILDPGDTLFNDKCDQLIGRFSLPKNAANFFPFAFGGLRLVQVVMTLDYLSSAKTGCYTMQDPGTITSYDYCWAQQSGFVNMTNAVPVGENCVAGSNCLEGAAQCAYTLAKFCTIPKGGN